MMVSLAARQSPAEQSAAAGSAFTACKRCAQSQHDLHSPQVPRRTVFDELTRPCTASSAYTFGPMV